VNALLLLARLDDSEGLLPTDLVDLVDLDDLVLEEVARIRRSSEIRVDVSGVSGGQVRGNAILLGQVVHNLVDNAVRHAARTVGVSVQEHAQSVEMVVEDDGVGIPEADRERVFERFVRLDEARTREAGGAGLGLAIVRRILEVSGGSVELGVSAAGGARFSVTLPSPTEEDMVPVRPREEAKP
jgi:signal transduction histidine kinase